MDTLTYPFVLISTRLVGHIHLNSILMKSILYNISVQTAIKLIYDNHIKEYTDTFKRVLLQDFNNHVQ